MNNLSSSQRSSGRENVDVKLSGAAQRTRTLRNFSAFSLIVPTQCNSKFSLLHWKSCSAGKNYYNSWISGELKAEMDKISRPNRGPTSLRYFKWEICVISRRKSKKFASARWKIFLCCETFYRHGRGEEIFIGEKTLWRISESEKCVRKDKIDAESVDFSAFQSDRWCALEIIG